ncbi:uncharacterized protein VTP21DRAFT_9332 [Calcarisporiella thermophila]|uniref:uncharacterized protein n=1 Tax=Calcarisporiella thermophila TaxID=911321 RepID=UPI0037431136
MHPANSRSPEPVVLQRQQKGSGHSTNGWPVNDVLTIQMGGKTRQIYHNQAPSQPLQPPTRNANTTHPYTFLFSENQRHSPRLDTFQAALSPSIKRAIADPLLKDTVLDAAPRQQERSKQRTKARMRFEIAVRRYYYQLTVGCNRQDCSNKFCASRNATTRLNPETAALMAMQLASSPKHKFCPGCPTNPTLNVPFLPAGNGSGIDTSTGVDAEHQPRETKPFLFSLCATSSLARLFTDKATKANSPALTGARRATIVSSTQKHEPSTPTTPQNPPDSTCRKPNFTAPHDSVNLISRSQARPAALNRKGSRGESNDIPESVSLLSNASAALPLCPSTGIESNSVIAPSSRPSMILKEPTPSAKTITKNKGYIDLPHRLSVTAYGAPPLRKSPVMPTSPSELPGSNELINTLPPPPQLLPRNNYSETPLKRGNHLRTARWAEETIEYVPSGAVISESEEERRRQIRSEDISDTASSAGSFTEEESSWCLDYLTTPLLKRAIATYDTNAVQSEERRGSLGATEPESHDGSRDEKFLLNSLRTVFSNPDCLARSFSAPVEFSPTQVQEGPPEDLSWTLDLQALRESYRLIYALKPRDLFASTVLSSLDILLARQQLDLDQELSDPALGKRAPVTARSVVLVCIAVFECPFLHEHEQRESLLSRLFALIRTLPASLREQVVGWFAANLDFEGMTTAVSHIQDYLTRRFRTSLSVKPDAATIAVVQALSLLNDANSRHSRLPVESFYNDTVCKKLDIKLAYKAWRQRHQGGGEFSFFDYGFLLDPGAKSLVLRIDAMVQMSHEYEDACVNQTLMLHTPRLLPESPLLSSLEQDLFEVSCPYFVLNVRRESLVRDALTQIARRRKELKKPLKVRFIGSGEEGVDQGGVTKEFFQILMAELLDQQYGMFTRDEETRFTWFLGNTLEPESKFELAGILLGLAVYNGVVIGVDFAPLVYKKLLGHAITLGDVKESFPRIGHGLQKMLDWNEGDVYDVFMRHFEYSYEAFGEVKTLPLEPGGEDRPVTNENRKEYVDKYIHHLVTESVAKPFGAFRRGFLSVCDGLGLRLCRAIELERLVSGDRAKDLDFAELERTALYDDTYTRTHPTIRAFWEVARSLTPVQKRQLLLFVTASDRVPVRGLSEVTFVVQRNGPDTDRLPTALTCFGRLLLPEYASKEKLRERLVTAIENAQGFGLV